MGSNGVDICGIVLYTLFFFLVSVRVRPFIGDGQLSSTDRIKLAFHCALLGSSLLELVHYAIALAHHGSIVSYALHLVALWLSLVAFSLVIVLWSNTLNPPRRAAAGTSANEAGESRARCCKPIRLSGTTIFVVTIDTAVAATTIAVLWTGSVPAYSLPYLILVVAHSVTLFLLASWLVLYGIRLQRRVMGHPRWEPLDRRQRLKILCRINGVLVVCAVCFLVRVAVLSSALFVRSRHRAEEMNRFLFELLARWLSSLIPGVALLHIMCKTKRPGEERAAQQQLRVNTSHGHPLHEPLLLKRGPKSGDAGRLEEGSVGKTNGNYEAAPTDGNNTDGAGVGLRGTNDGFVYHVVRSQGRRTETTI